MSCTKPARENRTILRLTSCVLRTVRLLTHYALRITSVSALLLIVVLLPPGAASAQDPPDGDPRFGLVLVPPERPWLQRAIEAGARSNRYQLNWWDVQPTPGEFDWSQSDRAISAMRTAGLDVTLLLHAPPAWARAPGSTWVPAHLDTAWDDPQNAWGAFVFETVNRYRGKVRYYEIFNEPDLEQYWDGTPEQYARTLAVAYRAARAADPDARIILAGMAHWSNPRFAEEVLQALRNLPEAESYNYFFDVAAWHWYSSSYQLYDRVMWARRLLNRYGMSGKPIWINETNLPIWGDGAGPQQPARGFGTPEEQAAFIAQAFTNAFAAGAKRVFIFRLDDGDMEETFGLMHDDGTPRPGYSAYRTTAELLGGSRFVTRDVRDTAILTVFRRAGERISVVWNRTEHSTAIHVSAIAEQAQLISRSGASRTIHASEGEYEIILPAGRREMRPDGQLVTPVGGAPFFLVERDTTPPQVEVAGLPALSADETVSLAWETTTPSAAPIARYEVERRVDDGPWESWRVVTRPSLTFVSEMGHRYAFRVRAVDVNGLSSPWPPADQPMAETVVGGALVGRVATLLDEPMAGQRVCAAEHCTRTDEAGFFRLEGLPPGETDVRVLGHRVTASVTVEAGAERTVTTLRPALSEGLLEQSDLESLSEWVVLPRADARIRSEGDKTTFAQLAAGTRLAQHIQIPAEQTTILYLRYRTNGASLDVRLVHLQAGRKARRLFYDTDTLGEWREIGFDLSALSAEDALLVLEADGSDGTLDLDTVWLGPPPQGTELFLPMVTN